MQNVKEINSLDAALKFYLLVNKLKTTFPTPRESIAGLIYEAMILATATNSEYNRVDNLGCVHQMILFQALNEHFHNDLVYRGNKLQRKDEYKSTSNRYYDLRSEENTDSRLAFDSIMNALRFAAFFDKINLEHYGEKYTVVELYEMASALGLTSKLGPDNEKNFEIFKFYYQNKVLVNKDRTGWDKRHWNVNTDRIEKIAEHIIGTIGLALSIYSEFPTNVDINKVIETLVIHEIGEIGIGDITPFDGVTVEQKKLIEHEAVKKVLDNLSKKDEMYSFLVEFDEEQTEEAKFAHYCDKLEADIQAKVYQDRGLMRNLNDQANNVVFGSSKIRSFIENGATTAFDIWYLWDKNIYEEAPAFKKTLNYVKNKKLY